MVQSAIQNAFHTGELAPTLYARVDLQKYHSAAALLRNFYVDYRGGVSTRSGTKYINRTFRSGSAVRLIPFQPSANTSYTLEFGDGYIRFFTNGAAVLEASFAVTGIAGNSITAAGNNFNAGDWVFIGGSYYIVLVAGSPFTVSDLWGNSSVTPTGTTAARVYTLSSPFRATDLFPNPITGNAGIKFVQSVQSLIICHTSYPPQILTIISAASWTISAISFVATIGTPTNLAVVSTDTPSNAWYYGYLVTAVDMNGQESSPPAPVVFAGTHYIGDSANSIANTVSWTAVGGASSYNVYAATPSFKATPPAGAEYGFIANVTGTSFIESFPGLTRDFAQTPPVVQNPFSGSAVASIGMSNFGVYTSVPTVTLSGGGGTGATAQASLGVTSATINQHANGNDDITTFSGMSPVGAFISFANGVLLQVTAATNIGGSQWTLNSTSIAAVGSITSGSTPSNPVATVGFSFPIIGLSITGPPNLNFNFTWGVTQVNVINGGGGYTSAPSVAFSAGAAAATAILSSVTGSNPAVPGFLQERLVLAGLANSPMTFDMSQPASFFNFNVSNPIQPDDAITGTIFSGELNDIKSLTPVPTGLLLLSGRLAWIVNGGGGLSAYNPITPANAVANPQTFTGANDLPPLKINQDLLYVTHKGSYVRDLNYNIYANVFSGQDISVLSAHLFFNHYLIQWAWAEEPFKVAWAVREDGDLLSLTYVKDQELIGWCHHDTNGQFKSVCTVLETTSTGNTVDAIYVVVQRFINGQTVQYVERLTDRYFTYGKEDSWSVDAGLQTVANKSPTTTLTITGNVSTAGNSVTLTDTAGAPFTAAMATNSWTLRDGFGGIYTITAFTSSSQVTASVTRVSLAFDQYTNAAFPIVGYSLWQPVTAITGLQHLQGQAVTGVADGVVVSGTVSATGGLTLSTAASKVTLGLAFTPQLQTLPLELGNPTIQGKPKQINAVSVRVADTLGLSIGSKFSTIVAMKESTLGNQNYYLNAVVGDLISADTRTQVDSTWSIPGQYCIQQTLPYPASILGVIPEFANTQRQG